MPVLQTTASISHTHTHPRARRAPTHLLSRIVHASPPFPSVFFVGIAMMCCVCRLRVCCFDWQNAEGDRSARKRVLHERALSRRPRHGRMAARLWRFQPSGMFCTSTYFVQYEVLVLGIIFMSCDSCVSYVRYDFFQCNFQGSSRYFYRGKLRNSYELLYSKRHISSQRTVLTDTSHFGSVQWHLFSSYGPRVVGSFSFLYVCLDTAV